jgi:hypothetical protein
MTPKPKMKHPTFRTRARLLAPWRTIRRLERRNNALSDALANPTLTGIAIHKQQATMGFAAPGAQMIAGMFLGLLQGNPKAVNYLELTFGSSEGNILVTVHRPGGATPHNLRALAEQEAREAKQEAECLRGDLATAREAVRRLVRWLEGAEGCDLGVVRAVHLWAIENHMADPLPPLPERLAKPDAAIIPAPTPEATP